VRPAKVLLLVIWYRWVLSGPLCVCARASYHDWRVDQFGNKVATGAATDAEQDIAAFLIFAQTLVDKGQSSARGPDGHRSWALREEPDDIVLILDSGQSCGHLV
jgi:hypothetical protein